MTLGPGILALAAFDGIQSSRNAIARVLVVFGRVPLFYYVIHIYAAHLIAIAVALGFHQPTKRLLDGSYFVSPPRAGIWPSSSIHLLDLALAERSAVLPMPLVCRVQTHASPMVAQLSVVLEATATHQMTISPWRTPRDTASVRVVAPSFARMELTWNFAVCSEMLEAGGDFFVTGAFSRPGEYFRFARGERCMQPRFGFVVVGCGGKQ